MIFPKDLLRGKVALITGASSETGPMIARTFSEVGADVALTYLTRADAAASGVVEAENRGVRKSAVGGDPVLLVAWSTEPGDRGGGANFWMRLLPPSAT